jgi:glycosyltransferase involved in cell wall biosynthesis
MRIVYFSETFLPKWDGVANTMCHLLDHLARHGHASLMFAPEGSPPVYAGTRIIGLSCFSFPLYPDLKLVPPLLDVRREMRRFQPDLVHIVNPAVMALAGLRHANELDVPVVASYHTDIPGYAEHYGLSLLRDPLWAYLRWLHNKADLNLCPSRFTQEELVRHGFERVKTWTRGVDTTRFHPQHRSGEWRERMSGGEPGAPLLVYVGRLAPEKRVEWLRPILDALPGVRLAIVGDGPHRPTLEEHFRGTPTVFTGYLKGHELAQAYASGDVFVFPSANETFGNVVLEAMASGLPAVAANAGGPVDHVVHGENGFLITPDDQQAWIEHVRRLVNDPVTLHRMGQRARRDAESRSWASIMDQLLEDYADLLRNRKRVSPQMETYVAPPKSSPYLFEPPIFL